MAAVDYLQQLNDYQMHLANVADLSAHLLDESLDADLPEWRIAASHMMRRFLRRLEVISSNEAP